MKKNTLLTLLTSIALVCLLSTNCFAFTKLDTYKTVKPTPENIQKYEKKSPNTNLTTQSIFKPDYTDPGSDAVRVVTCSPWTTGILYTDGTKSGVLGTISNVALTVSGYLIKVTVINMVKDVGSLVYGLASDAYDNSRGCTVELKHSFSYVDKLGQYYNSSNGWITKAQIQERIVYKTEFASFVANGRTYGNSINIVAPIKIEYKNHYTDNTWITNETMYYAHSINNYHDYYADSGISFGY